MEVINMEWKPIIIDDKETRYIISEYGDVKNNETGKLIKPRMSTNDYLVVDIYPESKKKKTYTVHRLVAIAFNPNPLNKKTVNHDDGNHINNHYKNLIWATYGENNQHAYDTGLKDTGMSHNFTKYEEADVRKIAKLISQGVCGKDICEMLGLDKKKMYPYITNMKKGKIRKRLMDEYKRKVIRLV
ncbi:NUMOD4 motif protein [compost metagenome]